VKELSKDPVSNVKLCLARALGEKYCCQLFKGTSDPDIIEGV